MRKACVIGAGGFIGHNLIKRLKEEGWYVHGLDLKYPLYEETQADKFETGNASIVYQDLSTSEFTWNDYTRIYQLAADMGGAGFVFTGDNDADILTNSLSINIHVLKELKKAGYKGKIFYSSSVCAYPDEVEGKEADAYPASPPSNYGWEKLTSERLYSAYRKNYGLDTRIARFHNCFGPYGTYEGGREKSPAAICRKVIEATNEIEIWGNGEQLRPFIYIDDLLDGIEALMTSDFHGPVNLGPDSGITINDMVDVISNHAGKFLVKKYVDGPTGGQTRNANNDLAKEKLGWSPKIPVAIGLYKTYDWIKSEMSK